ncbi:type I polyketide synthase [Streptomyces physcomitrii]|uniref:type I polyketide synthase n=1 Tax=Streptomyces physcomitrii TaxID=2724184 RepID=UPI000B2743AE
MNEPVPSCSRKSAPGHEPVAVVGLACRLPGAEDPAAFWDLLVRGGDAVVDTPEDRRAGAPAAGYPAPHGGTAPHRGGYLRAPADFDAAFFGISPREADAMDPQARLVLELGWEALEHAGIPATRAPRTTAVYIGSDVCDYADLARRHGSEAVGHHTLTGLQRALIANRLSYALGVSGPSVTVDSAQSSSLVSVQMACDSLRLGDSALALAGGVHLNLSPDSTRAAAQFGALSPDGRCHTFDARANGYVRGEGGALIVLKLLSAAVADGDRVLAVIRGGAVNNDGTGRSLTTPDAAAQQEVLRAACARAGVDPAHLDYVELHGTGTRAGDPVEATALGAVLGRADGRATPLAVGSVKTNIGHLEGAAGAAGLLKTVLCLAHGTLVPSLHHREPHPAVDLAGLNLRVQTAIGPWTPAAPDRPLLAGVSSFGMGGTNAHLVLAQAPAAEQAPRAPREAPATVPWLLSAHTPQAFKAQAERLADHVTRHPADPVDTAWSLLETRAHLPHRAVVVGTDPEDLVRGLATALPAGPVRGDIDRPVFVFPGQGSQWVGMAGQLLAEAPAFATRLAECAEALAPHVDWDLMAVLRGDPDAPSLDRSDVVQPALWAVMVSLAAQWQAHGVRPAAVVGHSQGEIAAACVAGALGLADAARVVALRSKVLVPLEGLSGMVSLALTEADTRRFTARWGERVTLAALNGPSSTVVSADADTVLDILATAEREQIRARRVGIDYASHSPHVEPAREEMLRQLAPLTPRTPQVPFLSTVTGDWIQGPDTDAGYWYDNLRKPVLLEPVVRTLTEAGHGAFLEVSPHPVLTTPVQDTVETAAGRESAVVTGTLRREDGGPARFQTSLAALWARGADVDWTPFFTGLAPRRVALPTYAFQRRRHWLDDAPAAPTAASAEPAAAPARQADPTPGPVTDTPVENPLDLVRAHAAVVLGHHDATEIDPQLSFKELGFDSVTAVELRDRLASATGRSLPATAVYAYPTPARLAHHLGAGEDESAPEPTGAGAADADDPVVIVSMGCRYPGGVGSPEELWHLVREEADALSPFPTDRGWDLDGLFDTDPDTSGTTYVRSGGFLDTATEFDAAFFGISPREALAMDPQQRLLLETVWETLERAGLDPRSLAQSPTGVFVGATAAEYGPRLHEATEDVEGHLLTGTTASVASGRISYALGLEGPAVTVDTACSSSLVALHLAVRALRAGECSLALAAGATVMSSPGMFVEFSRQRGLAADGRCKPFAAEADGTGWAEGVGVLLLERLSDARANGHQVLAVVRGSAINQDGASNGLSAPSGPAQQRVIRAALADAGVPASGVDVVEAHGTGTKLGDPIEAQALLATYGREHDAENPLWLGSVKSNIGHTQAAAGVAGVIKTVQAMRAGTLPKSLHADRPSPIVDWSSGGVALLGSARPWDTEDGRPRRAAVSSFGISGTNAHVVLEQPPALAEDASATEPAAPAAELPWLLSARNADALAAQHDRLREYVAAHEPRPVDVAWSLVAGRSVFEHRAVVMGGEVVASGAAGASGANASNGAKPVFVFPGQGAQWVGMAVELLDSSPVFAERFGECAAALEEFVEWSLFDVVRGVEGAPGFDRVDVVQPALWAVMVSLAALWESYGVRPAAVVGHSQGEIAAACVAGALSLTDGARVVALRSRALVSLAGRGGMVSVAVDRARAEELAGRWPGRVSVAALNGPSSTVVSGDADALDELVGQADELGVRARRIEVDYASHSAHVDAIEAELAELLAPVVAREPEVPFFSTVTGEWVNSGETDASYWFRNLRGRVLLEPVVRALVEEGHGVFVEVSPHPVLAVPVGETVEALGVEGAVVGSLRRDQGGLERMYASLGEAWAHGVEVDWSPVFAGQSPQRVDLPTYAFQRQRYWLESAKTAADVAVDPVEAEFWASVERNDLDALGRTLGVEDAASLGEVVPLLSSWRRERLDRSTLDGWRYRIAWRELAVPAAGELNGTWLLVTPAEEEGDDALTAGLREALAARADRVVVLPVPVRDGDRARYAALLSAAGEPGEFAGVLSTLGLREEPHPAQASVPLGLAAGLALVQALGDTGIEAPLWFLTRGAVGTGQGDAPTAALQAGVWGLGRVAALEHPGRWGGLVDLPADAGAETFARLTGILAGCGGEDQLALRDGKVLGRRLVPAPTGGRAPARDWSPRGTVLVTGGTGALGGHIARWLARNGAEHLVLTGRRGDAPHLDALRADLEPYGTRLTVAGCDTSDRDAVAELVARLDAEGTPVRAVLHAAGVSVLGPLAEVRVEDLAATFSGKVLGADHLDEVLAGREVDAVVYFSSISGTWGVADHAAYGSANAVLDARAEQRRAEGSPVLSVAWGPWAGGGMIAESVQEDLRRRGVPVIAPETAVVGLQQALDHDESYVAVADVDWGRFTGVFTSVRRSPLLDELPGARPAVPERRTPEAAEGHAPALREIAALDPARRTAALHTLVAGQVAAALGHQDAGALSGEAAFKELGFDSLTAVELRNRLGRTLGLTLPTTVVFDHPSIVALTAFVQEQAFGREESAAESARPSVRAAAGEADDPVVIVSMGCRYPGGVGSPEELWRLVREEADTAAPFPTDRGWDLDGLFDADPDHLGTSYVRESSFLKDPAGFDAGFFGISPREALAMDPQQRLLLETTWETLERGGIDPKRLRGSSTGVYVGLTDQEYASLLRKSSGENEGYLATGAAASVASGRISYALGLEGPAVTVDTACSSSLVALHLAVRALRAGECTLAVAAAATVMSGPSPFVAFSRQRALAPDGRCKPFAAGADGFALAEGVGVVLLERLSDARANGHRVLAVVRGSAVNQDGASNGLSAPNGPSQQRVIRAALADAGVPASGVDVVEAHGTGTKLGDPIEAQALLATYGRERDPEHPLWLGSVKSNIGHTQAASGMAGIIKMVQAMAARTLPKSLCAEEPSPFVDWSGGAVELLDSTREWAEPEGRPRRAAVSSFGISGTNAHVILEAPEEAPAPAPEEAADLPGAEIPLLVSAREEAALTAQTRRILDLSRTGDVRPVDVAWSLVAGRSAFEHRAVLLGGGVVASGVAAASGANGSKPVFVFPGQGAQWAGMAVELLDSSPVFAERFGECAAALDEFVEWSLFDVVRGAEGAPGFDRVDVVQPALWAVMVSLAALWESYGVRPAAVVGHSQGEIAAACVAGALSLVDGARVVALRSRALSPLAGRGGMVSVALGSGAVEDLVGRWGTRLSVAAVNGPSSTVVSGDVGALDELMGVAESLGVRTRRIEVDYASHSAHVDAIEAELAQLLAPVVAREPEVPFFSTVTGEWVNSAETDAGYWFRNLRSRVLLEPVVRALVEEGHGVFVEVSPHPVLAVPVGETVEAAGVEGAVVGSLRRGQGGLERMYGSLGEAWAHGVEVDWSPVFAGISPRRVDLPTYAFQRQRYWLESAKTAADVAVDPVEAEFWASVERNDLDALGRTLGVEDAASLGEVVPLLSSWRRERLDRSTLDGWRYRIAWRAHRPSDSAQLNGSWLLITPVSGADENLVESVRQTMEKAGAEVDVLALTGPADRAALVSRLRPRDAEPAAGVLSLLAFDETSDPGSPAVSRGLVDSLVLAQALTEAGGGRLWALTRGAVTVDGTAAPDPVQAAVRGMLRVAGLDDPERCGGLIDLPADGVGEDLLAAVPALLAAEGTQGRETEYAVRAEGVHVRRMVRAPLDPSADGGPWQPRGTVLVTGGTGALGGHVARDLARSGAEHLLLASRSGAKAPGAPELEQELTALGCKVTLASCDIADRAAVEELVRTVPAEFPLTAVVHTAGAVDLARPLTELDTGTAVALMHAKVAGARNLHEVLAGRPLDAFVLFSSGAGVWGNTGQAPYAAANAYLDALAELRRAEGLPATAIAWGAWAGGGMVDTEVGENLARRGVPAMPPQLAVRAVRESAADPRGALVVADIRWDRFLTAYSVHGHRPLLDEVPDVQALLAERAAEEAAEEAATGTGNELLRELAALPQDKRRRRLTEVIRAHAAAVLTLGPGESVKAGRAFRDMGFDSLTAVDLRNRLGTSLGAKLSATLVFDHPTPKALADHLAEELLPEEAGPGDGTDPRLEGVADAYRKASGPAERQELADALRALLDEWAHPTDEPEQAAVDEELVDASDQDMFELIDRELGIS